MKKNIFLLMLVSALVIFIYYFEEVQTINDLKTSEMRTLLINRQALGELKEYSTPNVTLSLQELDKKQFIVKENNLPVDEIRLQKIFKIIANIRSKRRLNINLEKPSIRKEFFPDETKTLNFTFEKGRVQFLLGQKLDFDQSFYLQVKTNGKIEYHVAEDISAMAHAYEKENHHRSSHKYKRLESLLYLKKDFYYDTKVLRQEKNNSTDYSRNLARFNNKNLTRVHFENFRNRPFSVFYKEMKTNPKAYSGVEVDRHFFDSFKKWPTGLYAQSIIYPYNKNELKTLLSTVTLHYQEEKVIFKVYQSYQDKKGHFVVNERNKKYLFPLTSEMAAPFFYNVQDFWDKTILRKNLANQNSPDSFKMIFKKGPLEKKVVLLLPQKNPSLVQIKGPENHHLTPKYHNFKTLLAFLAMPADRISAPDEMDLSSSKAIFKIDVNHQLWKILYKEGILFFKNNKDRFLLHYNIGDHIPFGTEMQDYFDL